MKVIAIIPARGGSKGIPGKNLKKIADLSLVSRAIVTAHKSYIFDYIFVSTDSTDIQQEALKYGANCSFLRSPVTSSDSASSEEAIQEVISHPTISSEAFDVVCLLEPTSPSRFPAILKYCITTLLQSSKFTSITTVSDVPKKFSYQKQLILDPDGFTTSPIAHNNLCKTIPRQHLNQSYIRNGILYACTLNSFKSERSLITKNNQMVKCDFQCFNIDDADDLINAQSALQHLSIEEIDYLNRVSFHPLS